MPSLQISKELPVHIDAGLSEHEEPEIHVGASGVEGVVDEHAAVGDPQGGENGHDAGQHLHDLKN